MRFAFDKLSLRSFDVDGRLEIRDCRISKANVCPYFGREIPGADLLGLDPERIYNLYRDPEELARGASSFANLQLLLAHIPVAATDPQIELTAGTVGSDVRYEHPYLIASLKVWTAEAIKLIESGEQRQLSCSYRYRADMTPGTTPEGVAYDGVMRDIIGNHVALVEAGRAGPDVIVNDSLHFEAFPMKFSKLLAAVKAHLKADADLVAADAAIAAVVADNSKPRSTVMLRVAKALQPFAKGPAIDFSPLAADASIEEEMKKAEDEADEDDETADDEVPRGDPVDPGPKKGEVGAALDAAIKAGNLVSKADVDALVAAAKIDGANDAVARVNALHAAREAVAPLVGVVALDSAEAVYRFALDKAGVTHKDVHASALPSLVDMAKRNRAAAPVAPVTIAADAAMAAAELPGLSRVSRA